MYEAWNKLYLSQHKYYDTNKCFKKHFNNWNASLYFVVQFFPSTEEYWTAVNFKIFYIWIIENYILFKKQNLNLRELYWYKHWYYCMNIVLETGLQW
jgi:hypothetical protein